MTSQDKSSCNGNGLVSQYRALIDAEKYDEAEKLERKSARTRTIPGPLDPLLTYVISEKIMDRESRENGLATRLLTRFNYRGYCEEWIKEYAPELVAANCSGKKTIKGKNAGKRYD
jgi:hypothetical protein